MPELPEVETLRRTLYECVVGRQIRNVTLTNPKVLKGQSEAEFRNRVVGKRIADVTRRGKYLLAPLVATESPSFLSPDTASVQLCIHLKMRGKLIWNDAMAALEPYHCLSMHLDDGRWLRYHDAWGWGEVRALTRTERERWTPIDTWGEDPLSPGWSPATLAGNLEGRRGAIKLALLDQRVAPGMGNIYCDEALFRARIHPERPVDQLSSQEIDRLAAMIRAVIEEAVRLGGSRGEFRSLRGETGSYEPQVYDRGGKPCPRRAELMIRIRLGGRGTVYCPRCQEEKLKEIADNGPKTKTHNKE